MTHAALKDLIELSPRALELAERLVAAGPKAAHVSASETHEIADFVRDAVAALSAMEGEVGGTKCPLCDAPVKVWPDYDDGRGTSYEYAPPPQQAADSSALLALAEKWEACAVVAEPLPAYILRDVAKELRALATQPQQAGGDDRVCPNTLALCACGKFDPCAATMKAPGPAPQGGGEYWLNLYVGDNTENYAYRSKDAAINAGCPEEDGDRIAVHVQEVTTPPAHQPGEVVKLREMLADCIAYVSARDAYDHEAEKYGHESNRGPMIKVRAAVMAAVKKYRAVVAALAPKEAGHDR